MRDLERKFGDCQCARHGGFFKKKGIMRDSRHVENCSVVRELQDQLLIAGWHGALRSVVISVDFEVLIWRSPG